MSRHEQAVKAAKAALDAVFSDRSVSATQTRASLTELRDEVEVMLDALKADDRGLSGGNDDRDDRYSL